MPERLLDGSELVRWWLFRNGVSGHSKFTSAYAAIQLRNIDYYYREPSETCT